LKRYGDHALVTGAAQGIGRAFAEALASAGMNLTLVDVQEDALSTAAEQLRSTHACEVIVIPGDVAEPTVTETILECDALHRVGVAVVNAAVAPIGDFLEGPVGLHRKTLDVNCGAALELIHPLAQRMVQRRNGAIVMLSSGSALSGSPRIAHYAATKAYLKTLAEGLWDELRPHGVDVIAALPGLVRTPAMYTSNPRPNALRQLPVVDPAVVAEETLAALGKGPLCFPGTGHRLAMGFASALPRALSRWLTARQVRRLYPK